jgi:hypothetical protein
MRFGREGDGYQRWDMFAAACFAPIVEAADLEL